MTRKMLAQQEIALRYAESHAEGHAEGHVEGVREAGRPPNAVVVVPAARHGVETTKARAKADWHAVAGMPLRAAAHST